MKPVLFLLLFQGASAVLAQDATTLSNKVVTFTNVQGRVYRDVRLVRADMDGIIYVEGAGGGRVLYTNLSASVLESFGIPTNRIGAMQSRAKEKAALLERQTNSADAFLARFASSSSAAERSSHLVIKGLDQLGVATPDPALANKAERDLQKALLDQITGNHNLILDIMEKADLAKDVDQWQSIRRRYESNKAQDSLAVEGLQLELERTQLFELTQKTLRAAKVAAEAAQNLQRLQHAGPASFEAVLQVEAQRKAAEGTNYAPGVALALTDHEAAEWHILVWPNGFSLYGCHAETNTQAGTVKRQPEPCRMEFTFGEEDRARQIFDKFLEWEAIASTNKSRDFVKVVAEYPNPKYSSLYLTPSTPLFLTASTRKFRLQWSQFGLHDNDHAQLSAEDDLGALGRASKADVLVFRELVKSLPALKEELVQQIRKEQTVEKLFK